MVACQLPVKVEGLVGGELTVTVTVTVTELQSSSSTHIIEVSEAVA